MKKPGIIFSLLLFLFNPIVFSESAKDLFETGNKAFKDHLFSIAAGSFEKLLITYPHDKFADDAQYFLGLSRFYSRQYNQIISGFSTFIQKYPESPFLDKINYWLGASYYYLKNYKQSIKFLNQQLNFKNQGYYYQQSLILKGVGLKNLLKYREAALCFNQLIESDLKISQAAYIYYQAGNNELLAKNFKKAGQLFNRILINFPESKYFSDSLFYSGESDFFLANYSKAIERYTRLLEFYWETKHKEAALLRLAQIHYHLKDYDLSLDFVQKIILEHPLGLYYAEALKIKSDIFMEKEDYEEALYQYHLILDFLKEDEEIRLAHYNNALLFSIAKDYESSVESLLKAFNKDDKELNDSLNHKIRLKLADLYVILQEYDKASEYLELYLNEKQSPYQKQALIIFAKLQSHQGEFEKSIQFWDKILAQYAHDNEQDEFLFLRADTYLRAKKYSSALIDFHNIIKNHKTSDLIGECEYKIGYIYTERNEYKRALDFYKQAAEWGKGTPLEKRALLAIGINYFNFDDITNAIEYFNKLKSDDNLESKGTTKTIIKKDNWKGLALFYLGKCQMKKENLLSAISYFNQSFDELKEEPQGAEILYWVGWCEYRRKNMKKAKSAFLKLTRLYKNSDLRTEAFFRAGLAAEDPSEQNYGDSLLYYNKALSLDKNIGKSALRENILYQKGVLLTILGDSGKAQDVFEKLAKEYPQSELAADAWFELGREDMKNRNYLRAISRFEEFKKLFKMSRLMVQAYLQLAVANNKMGYSEKSLDYYYLYLKNTDQTKSIDQIIETIKVILKKQTAKDALVLKYIEKISNDEKIDVLVRQKINFEYSSWLLDRKPDKAFESLNKLQKEVIDNLLSDKILFRIGEYYIIKKEYEYAQNIFKGLSDSANNYIGAESQNLYAELMHMKGLSNQAIEEYIKTSYLFPQFKEISVQALCKAYGLLKETGKIEDAEKIKKKILLEYNETSFYSRNNSILKD